MVSFYLSGCLVSTFLVCSLVIGLATSEAYATSSSFHGRRTVLPFVRGGSVTATIATSNDYSAMLDDEESTLHMVLDIPKPLNGKKVSKIEASTSNSYHHSQATNKHTDPTSTHETATTNTNANYEFMDNAHLADMEENDLMPATFIADTKLPTDVGMFRLRAYRTAKSSNEWTGTEPCVIYHADRSPFASANAVPVRIHDQCLTSEVFRSKRCDCKEQLVMALEYVAENGGAIIYLQQEGRGIGLANKVAAYALQDDGMDTVDANLHLGFPEDCRQYGAVPSILQDLQISSIQLLTNNPRKVDRLLDLGVTVEGTIPMVIPEANPHNFDYLQAKAERMNHDNLVNLLSRSKSSMDAAPANGIGMMPGRRSAGTVKTSGVSELSTSTKNSVHVTVRPSGEVQEDARVTEETELGVLAKEDGYCFGKQSVQDAIDAMRNGEMVVVVDDMNRENEGDLIMAAEACRPIDMAQIVRYSSGVICIGMEGDRMDALKLPAMCTNNEDPKGTAFSVTVDACKEHGITTGISAQDRATTVNVLADPRSGPLDFHRPGHIFPLRAQEGGVLTRDGHTEAAVDLSILAGRGRAGILCEIVSEENPTEMARLPELKRFCQKHGYVLTSIVDIAQYRKDMELLKL